MTELHVIPDERTTWRVYEDGTSAPLSEHTNATDAERAAFTRAEARDAPRVVVHDRYHRTHDAAGSRAEVRARARDARAHQLALVRERVRPLPRRAPPPPRARAQPRAPAPPPPPPQPPHPAPPRFHPTHTPPPRREFARCDRNPARRHGVRRRAQASAASPAGSSRPRGAGYHAGYSTATAAEAAPSTTAHNTQHPTTDVPSLRRTAAPTARRYAAVAGSSTNTSTAKSGSMWFWLINAITLRPR